MSKSLIIVESPSKAKTINKYLGKDYIVEASVGHIKNLPKSKIGVDVQEAFAVSYETIAGKEKVLSILKSKAEEAKEVFIATDPDREGEAIAAHIAEEIRDINPHIKRVLFREITENGVREGMENAHKINTHMVMSQQARRAMDRLVGYMVSPFIWRTMYYGLSAGRVQSVALKLICERELEIKAFQPEEYWTIEGRFSVHDSEPFAAKLMKIDGGDVTITSEFEANRHAENIRARSFSVSRFDSKPVKRNAPMPFITSTLQQEASRKLGFSAKRTMALAQKLYEGVEIGKEGAVGLITYMRTDSTRLSADAVLSAKEYVQATYGHEYVPEKLRGVKKGKMAQDAHEAIRPTDLGHTPEVIKKYLEKDALRLYELIWNRFIASQMAPAVFDQITLELEGGEYLFRSSDRMVTFKGFLAVYDDADDETEAEQNPSKLPMTVSIGDPGSLKGVNPEQHFTEPPPRFTEASLVKELEADGIGRPSTYAMIVSTVIDRKYVEQKERKLFATDLGLQVNTLLQQYFPEIFSVSFTAKMEKELDTVANGKEQYIKVMNDFYNPFIDSINHSKSKESEIKKSLIEVTDEVCDLCGKKMVIKWGRNGRFMACSGYPKCKNTKSLPGELEAMPQITGVVCEKCGGDMMVKVGRFGSFIGCSNYPKCDNTKPLSTGIKCPTCVEGDIIERKTKKRKRVFYGCSRYPDCDFASWDKPVIRKCDHCDSKYVVEKTTKAKGTFLVCPVCKSVYEATPQAKVG